MNYLIFDDEPQARKLLQLYMETIGGHHLAGICATAMEAYDALHLQKVDCILLDISMPVISGIDFLRSLENPPFVIFTTAYPEYALKGYELDVVDYLLKPVSLERLAQAINKTQDRINQYAGVRETKAGYTFFKVDKSLIKIRFADILMIEGMQNYVRIHLRDHVMISFATMKSMEALLPEKEFLRVHRSYIVSVQAITAFDEHTVHIKDIGTLPIGVSYKGKVAKNIRKKLGLSGQED